MSHRGGSSRAGFASLRGRFGTCGRFSIGPAGVAALIPPGLAILLAACASHPTTPPSNPSAPIPVHTVAVNVQDWPSTYEASGTVRARTSANLASKVTGYVQQVAVRQGDRVAAGQTLIVLDTRDLDANYRRADAGVAEVNGAIPEADSAVAAAKANLDLARVTAKRIDELAAKKSVSNQEVDESNARLQSAQASYDMARARRTQLQSRLDQATEERRAAAIIRDYGRIAAPFAGIVTAKTVNPGDLATTGAPLLTIERQDGYRLEAAVDESKLASVRVGQSVRYALDLPGCAGQGRVSEVVPAVDPASRSYIARIDLPACAGLRSGMFGRAFFQLGSRKAVAVASAAITERGQLQSVFVAEDGSAHARLVTIGERAGDAVEILSGLNPGESLIAPAPPGLADGAKIEVRP